MYLKLHGNATTTPKIRTYIQSSEKNIWQLAQDLGVAETTVRRWKGRSDTNDRSCRPHTIRRALTHNEEEIVLALRTLLRLPLDRLLMVTRRYVNAGCSRAALHRLLRRRGLPALRAARQQAPEGGWFTGTAKIISPEGYEQLRVDVAVDKQTGWVLAEASSEGELCAARSFADRLLKDAPLPVLFVEVSNDGEGVMTNSLLYAGVRVMRHSVSPYALHLDVPIPTVKMIEGLRLCIEDYNSGAFIESNI